MIRVHLVSVAGALLGAVQPEDLEAVRSSLPEGASVVPVNAIVGDDGKLYQVASGPLRLITESAMSADKATRRAGLQKLTRAEKVALGLKDEA